MSGYLDLDWLQVFIGGVSTLAIYSFLYKENSFYRFFEHLFIGIATSITVMQTFRNFLWPKFFKPMLGMDRLPLPDGSMVEPFNSSVYFYLIPMAFGLLYYCILSRRHAWMAQIVIGFTLGAAGGLTFKGFFNEVMPQIYDSFRPLYVPGELGTSVENWIFVFTLLTAFSYFFFTFRRRPDGLSQKSASAGRWMMMGCFGAFFGSTIMARMALLVERLEFLINTWVPNFFY